ncbi:hypothetical protein [Sphingobium yanoikuyae]|uniref:hypothetical protein n=1 Tax=Sphingobium yanoikuyae TaxID=13690 RepID=UPI000262C04A|nr:hypothetical protein [Sphingobium yanoikuyae]
MSWDWKPGDLAVCVDARPHPIRGAHPDLAVGKIYRVEAVVRVSFSLAFGRNCVSLRLTGIHAGNPSNDFAGERFRKLEAAEPAFTKAMRELRPLVEA